MPALGSLASYARKGDDAELEEMATRIRTRAMRRVGELLQEIEPAKGGDRRSDGFKGGIVPQQHLLGDRLA